MLGNLATWPIFVANFGMGASFLSFVTLWSVPYLVDVHGMTRDRRQSRHGGARRVRAERARDRHALRPHRRRKPLYVGGAAVLAAAWVPMLMGAPLGGFGSYLLFALLGAAAAGMTLSWACAKEVNAPQYAGIATGVVNMGIFLGPGVRQRVVVWVLDLSRPGGVAAAHAPQEWQHALVVLAGLALVGLASALFVREARPGSVARARVAR